MPLKPLKQKHLRQLCTSGAIPEEFHPYYESLLNVNAPAAEGRHEESDHSSDEDSADSFDTESGNDGEDSGSAGSGQADADDDDEEDRGD